MVTACALGHESGAVSSAEAWRSAFLSGVMPPPETSISKAGSLERNPARRLQLCQRQGQVSHTHIHWQDAEYKISPTSAATAVGYPTHMGATPGLLRGGTGDPPLARAEGSIDRGGPRQRKCSNRSRLCEHPKSAENTSELQSRLYL